MAHVLLVLPLGLPGSGKTTFLTAIYRKLRADRKFLQNKLEEISDQSSQTSLSSVNLLSTDLTGRVGEASSSLVRKFCQETAVRISGEQSGRHVVLLDKNHAVSTIWKSRELFLLPDLHVRTVVLNFQSTNRKFVGNFPRSWSFPFPIETFATCVSRVTRRPDHPTLPFSDSTATHVVSVLLRQLAAHRRSPSAFRNFRGLRGFEVLAVPAISVPQFPSRQTPEILARAVETSDVSALLAVAAEISVSAISEEMIGNFVTDFERRVSEWSRPRKYPRYFGVDLGSEKETFFRLLLETNFIADFSKIHIVPDPHVTLMYVNFARPENWEQISRAEDLAFMCGTRVGVEVRSAVYVEFGLLCLEVDLSGIENSLFPNYPHVTVCYAEPFKARHSNELLRIAKTIDFTNFHGNTPNGSLYSATGEFSIEGINFQRICVWKNDRNSPKLNGLITAVN